MGLKPRQIKSKVKSQKSKVKNFSPEEGEACILLLLVIDDDWVKGNLSRKG
jgi:hypothetical protein